MLEYELHTNKIVEYTYTLKWHISDVEAIKQLMEKFIKLIELQSVQL